MEEKEFDDFLFELGAELKPANINIGGYYKQAETYFYYEEYNKIIMVSKYFGITVLPEIFESPSDDKIIPCNKEDFENIMRETIFELGIYKFFKSNE